MPKPIVIDKEFSALIPAATDAELAGLEASLKREGCRDALVVWREKSILLDGHNRYRICTEGKIAYSVTLMSFPDRDAAMRWSIENQFGRRNLSLGARAMLAARLSKLGEGKPPGNCPNSDSMKKNAEKMAVSRTAVAEAKTVIADGTPALQQAVTDGKVPVSAAAKIVDLPVAEQDAAAAGGKSGVAAAAKKIMSKAEYEGTAPAKDQAGHDLPGGKPKIVEAFNRRAEIVAHRTAISKIRLAVQKAHEAKDPIYAELLESDFTMGLERASRALRYAMPHSVCPYCAGDGCKACKNKGWVGEAIYEAAPKEMK
jgi:hypothetical protein